MITDLFSHKIHSSTPEWQEKLIELACVFAEFDGQVYDREKIETRLQTISTRATFVARDASKFRDEISAYPAYLGLYRLELLNNRWVFRLSEVAKRYLTNEEPNVAAFMLLQLTLFQYPSGMGIAYYSNSDKLRIQANTRDRTFDFIKKGIHISPLRLICKGLEADATLREVSVLEAQLTYRELFILANHTDINQSALPDLTKVIPILEAARQGLILPPPHFETRLHILNHTDFLKVDKGVIRLRETVNERDEADILLKFQTINRINLQFNGFNGVKNETDFIEVIKKGTWSRYFDSLLTLNADVIDILANDSIFELPVPTSDNIDAQTQPIKTQFPVTYPFKKRANSIVIGTPKNRKAQFADPEITKIKRQRSNLSHKLILQQLDEYLRTLGAEPLENEHIDLFAHIPSDGKYLFEVKSIFSDNLLSQTRKGLSQLYEYRFRYKDEVGYDATLCLVLPDEPNSITWLQEYLCQDRQIAVIWFSKEGNLQYSHYCKNLIQPLLNV